MAVDFRVNAGKNADADADADAVIVIDRCHNYKTEEEGLNSSGTATMGRGGLQSRTVAESSDTEEDGGDCVPFFV